MRFSLTGIVLVVFLLAAYYLYQKQQLQLNFLSFKIENAEHSFIVPDVDRLVDKLNVVEDLEMDNWPVALSSGLNSALTHKEFSFNRELAQHCFISFNSSDFTLVLKTTTSINSLIDVVKKEFDIPIKVEDRKVTVNDVVLNSNHFSDYLVFSTLPITPIEQPTKLYYGNSDYVAFNPSDISGTRHILSDKYHFRLWEEESYSPKGRSVSHQEHFESAPADFDELVFYGSSRIHEDALIFFNDPNQESFEWLNEGLLYVKKGEFELVIAEQGENRDLSLMLEEQTLTQNSDTAQINYFNIGKYKILPFKTTFNWTDAMLELDDPLKFYTEYKNFNVISNSIPAMRWYIGQVQLGNLLENNQLIADTYADCLPETSHYVRMEKQLSGGFLCQSRIYGRDSTCLHSSVTSGIQQLQMEGVEIVEDFEVDIVPSKLTALVDASTPLLLLNNQSQLSMYTAEGEKKWALTLSTPLVQDPQIVDFENDGNKEIILFQSNQIDVVNNMGKSLAGFPVLIGGSSSAGIAVNYDNEFKWRLLVNVNNTVSVYSEGGKLVDGWMFTGMNSSLQGQIYHVITEGKDIITFKDRTDVQYVLSRKGEPRLTEEINFKLPNETDFIVGSLESALRKMGYKDGFIYNYYILDGQKDSVVVDQKVTPIKTYWEYNNGKPLLILEEPSRLLIVNEFGYVMSEVLKPNQSNQFVGLVGDQDYGFVFADNSENTIYLLNNYGKMILPQAVDGSATSIILRIS